MSDHENLNVNLHVYLHYEDEHRERVSRQLEEVLTRLRAISAQEKVIMQELDDLETQVKANTDAEAAALILINGIAARIEAAATDPAELTKLSQDLKSSADALSAAVVANTPPQQASADRSRADRDR